MTDQPASGVRSALRRARVGVVGGTTVAVGIVLLPLPGPGTLVILGGLTMLGREFPGARRAANAGWRQVDRVVGALRRR